MMKHLSLLLFLCFIFCAGSLRNGLAEEIAAKPLSISNAWVREAPPTTKVLAGYLEISNNTDQAITLSHVESPCFNHVMLHRTELVDGIATMRHSNEITINPHSSFSLSPGGHHLMLMGKKTDLIAGDDVELTLFFKDRKSLKITAKVRRPSSQ